MSIYPFKNDTKKIVNALSFIAMLNVHSSEKELIEECQLKKELTTLFIIKRSSRLPLFKDIRSFIAIYLALKSEGLNNTVLHTIMYNGLSSLKYVINMGIKINLYRCLFFSIEIGNFEIFRYLIQGYLSKILTLEESMEHRWTREEKISHMERKYIMNDDSIPIFYSKYESLDITEYLKDPPIHPPADSDESGIKDMGKSIYKRYLLEEALIYSTRYGRLDVTKFLLEKGDIIVPDNDIPLVCASQYGHLETVIYLLERYTFDTYVDAIKKSIENGHLEVVKYITKRYYRDDTCTSDSIVKALLNNHVDVVKYLIKRYKYDDYIYQKIVNICSEKGIMNIIKYILERNDNINLSDALIESAENGNIDIVKYLTYKGADIHVLREGPLRKACQKGHLEVVKFLVDQGADIDIDECFNFSWAAKYGHLEIVKYLVEKGSRFNSEKHDYTIRCSGYFGHVHVVEYLEKLKSIRNR